MNNKEKIDFDTINNIDCITIFVNYSHKRVIKDFRFKKQAQGVGIATRTGEFLEEWQGYVCFEAHSPILRLTKIDNKQVDIKIPLLKFDFLREVQLRYKLPFAKVIVKIQSYFT